MKHTTVTIVILTFLVIVLVIATAFATVSSVNAQLGNSGVPAKCFASASPTELVDLVCSAADGTPFGDSGKTVPTAHYLLVTDVFVYPSGPATGTWDANLDRLQGTTQMDSVPFVTRTAETFSEHFTTPYLVLKPGEHLRMNNIASTGVATFFVSGLLTTNVTYMPLTAR